jgi:hypothetical protein
VLETVIEEVRVSASKMNVNTPVNGIEKKIRTVRTGACTIQTLLRSALNFTLLQTLNLSSLTKRLLKESPKISPQIVWIDQRKVTTPTTAFER